MDIRMIPTKTHAVVDIAKSPALIAAPTLLRMNGNKGSSLTPRLLGSTGTIVALLTDYEFGVKRIVPMRAHLALDAISGVALAAMPFLTGGHKRGLRHWLPHALIGVNEVALALTTKQRPPRVPRLRALAPNRTVAAAAVGAIGAVAAVTVFAKRRTSDADDD